MLAATRLDASFLKIYLNQEFPVLREVAGGPCPAPDALTAARLRQIVSHTLTPCFLLAEGVVFVPTETN